MIRQPSWTAYEAAVLLDYFVATVDGSTKRSDAIKEASHILKQMAMNQNIEVDETYRNESGITFQMHSMESAYYGKTIFKPASRLFTDVVELYRNRPDEYQNLLKEAMKMANGRRTVEEDFIEYLAKKMSPTRLSELYSCYSDIESFCMKIKVLQKPLFQTTDFATVKKVQRTVEENKVFRITRKKQYKKMVTACRYYYLYIKENRFSTIDRKEIVEESVLSKTSTSEHSLNQEEDTIVVSPCTEKELGSNVGGVVSESVMQESSFSEIDRFLNDDFYLPLREALSRENIETIQELRDLKLMAFMNRNDIYFADERRNVYESVQERLCSLYEQTDNDAIEETKKIVGNQGDTPFHNDYVVETLSSRTPQHSNSFYESVLLKHFTLGFRLGSPIEIRKFRRLYKEVCGDDITDSDEEISANIEQLCIIYENRAYLPEAVLDDKTKCKLLNYIDSCFSNGKNIVYYKAICDTFSEDFINYPLYNNANLLMLYLKAVEEKDYFMGKKFISKDAEPETDARSEVSNYLRDQQCVISTDEIISGISHIPAEKVKTLLATSDELVYSGKGTYFHIETIWLSDEDAKDIDRIINEAILQRDFITDDELYEIAKVKCPDIVENNPEISAKGFYGAVEYKLKNRFSFSTNIISALGTKVDAVTVFANYARSHESFTLAELKTLADELGTHIRLEAVYENSLRVSRDQFVSEEQAQFDIDRTDSILNLLCAGDYIAIGKIQNFSIFPYAGFQWNIFLLEQYVFKYSHKYFLISPRFNQDNCIGAIVKRSSHLNVGSYDDFIVKALADSNADLNPLDALHFLADEGYIARRKYKNLDEVITKARAQRNQKKGM